MEIPVKLIFSLVTMIYLSSANPLSTVKQMSLKQILYELDRLNLHCKAQTSQIMCHSMVPKVQYEEQTLFEMACQASKSLAIVCKTGNTYVQSLCRLLSQFPKDCNINSYEEEDLHSAIHNLLQNFKKIQYNI